MLLVSLAYGARGDEGAGRIELTAVNSTGGTMVKFADGSQGVSLDPAQNVAGSHDVAIAWKLSKPLAAGWWHGVLEFGPREGDDRGWVNYHLGVVLTTQEKPMVNVMTNFHPAEKGPYRFGFWTYISTPAQGVRIEGVYDNLWKYKRSWPITRLTLEPHNEAAPAPDEPVTLDLPISASGAVSLPGVMRAGVWSLHGAMTKEGAMTAIGENGKAVRAPFSFDRWKRPAQICFYMGVPWEKMKFETPAMFRSFVMEQTLVEPAKGPAVEGALIKALDDSKKQTARLELIGQGLSGAAPELATFPDGEKIAVVTTWDDGKETDLRCAQVLAKHGYHPTFFMNQNSVTMKSLDKLEALGAEVGSHTLHHPSLHALPPEQAVEECMGMRKLLEGQLNHPVVSMAYPNGYTAAYDTDGDYVLRAVRAAGTWSGRTTLTGLETVDGFKEPLAFNTNGFFGGAADLERQWNEVKNKEGTVFHFWGHSWQIGKTDAQWQKFDELVAKFAGDKEAWYAAQGDLFYWVWLRKNVKMEVKEKSAEKVVLEVSRPWVHGYLAGRVPLTIKSPAGVTKVVWEGKEIVPTDGRIVLPWAQ